MSASALRCLFLGDSYTAGTAVAEDQRWPARLAQLARASGTPVEAPRYIAGNGWTTQDLMNEIAAEAPPNDYDRVFLLIGVNNQFHGRPLDEFEEHYPVLLDRAIELARGRAGDVFALGIPDYSETPFAAELDTARVAAEIEAFNTTCRVAAERKQVLFLDNTLQISRLAKDNPALLVEDGLHPSAEMYRLWSESLFESLSGRF